MEKLQDSTPPLCLVRSIPSPPTHTLHCGHSDFLGGTWNTPGSLLPLHWPSPWPRILSPGTSLVAQWLRLWALNAGGWGSSPGERTASHMLQLRPGAAKSIKPFKKEYSPPRLLLDTHFSHFLFTLFLSNMPSLTDLSKIQCSSLYCLLFLHNPEHIICFTYMFIYCSLHENINFWMPKFCSFLFLVPRIVPGIKKLLERKMTLRLPWCSSGYDSALPMQGVSLIPGQGTKMPHVLA